MMIVVKRAALLLLLVIGSNAAPAAKDCEGLNKTLPTEDLHKIFGEWVLVWADSDNEKGWELFPKINSSHVELRLLPDNKTIMFNERNFHNDTSCSNYILNMSRSSAPSDSSRHTLNTDTATVERDGLIQPYNDSGVLDLYESHSDCLVGVYRSRNGRFLLIYRREGHHTDVVQLKAAHTDFRKKAECLGFTSQRPFIYDGVSDFCHKKSSPVVKQEMS